jgi:hypothetical protein
MICVPRLAKDLTPLSWGYLSQYPAPNLERFSGILDSDDTENTQISEISELLAHVPTKPLIARANACRLACTLGHYQSSNHCELKCGQPRFSHFHASRVWRRLFLSLSNGKIFLGLATRSFLRQAWASLPWPGDRRQVREPPKLGC